MKAYGIPVQSVVWKQPTSVANGSSNGSVTNGAGLLGVTVRNSVNSSGNNGSVTNNGETATSTTHVQPAVATSLSVKQEVPDLEACHLTSKQLEEFMDDDCHGPVSSGDPMLSSPHLSPHGVLPSPASSGSHYSANDDALTPDSMDLAV